MHTPVLLKEAIDGLNVRKGGKYIDATFGEGGYSREILKRGGRVLGIDLDLNQLKSWRVNELTSLRLVQGNFSEIEKIAKENHFFPVEGVVFDLGLSMGQLNSSGRGFSYQKLGEPLDMRLDLMSQTTAQELIKSKTTNELYEIIAKNSEEIRSKEIAEEIKRTKKMEKVDDLVRAIDRAVGFSSQKVYARIFQALRIEVNDEFNNLKKGLRGAVNILRKNGRVVIVSFHSLEDRVVKNFVREKKLKLVNKKLIKGKRTFERSAKLRIIKII